MPKLILKSGWTRVIFGDVVELSRKRSANPKKDGLDRYVGLEHLEPSNLKISRWGNVSDGTTFTNLFRSGQVLFGKRRAYQRKVAVADFDGVCSGDIYVLESKPRYLLSDLLPYLCLTDSFFEHAIGTSAGSLSPRTNWESLASYEFILPPMNEQQRIADVLQSIQAAVQSNLALLRSAECVKASFAKRMFSDISGRDGRKGENGNSFRRQWRCLELRHLVEKKGLVRGPFGGTLKKEIFVDQGYMVYEQSHPISGNLSVGRYFISEQKYREMERFQVQKGDLIMSCSGTIGKVAVITASCPQGIINQALLKIRPNTKEVESRYLFEFLSSEVFATSLARLSMGSAMSNVTSVRQIERINIPLPPLAVQREIARSLDGQRQALEVIARRLQNAKQLLVKAANDFFRSTQ